MAPRVSIITATYTPERLTDVQQLLDSVTRQTSRDFEMIVVVERARELIDVIAAYTMEKKYNNIELVYNEGPGGASANRNLAIPRAKGDIIAFVDDDAVLSPDWVAEIIRSFDDDSSVIGVKGPILPLWQDKKEEWVPPEFFWIFSCTAGELNEKTEVRNGYCTNLSFRKEAFDKAGLFNIGLGVKGRGKGGWQEPGAEETELAIRIRDATGKRIVFNPKIIVQHKVYAYRLSGSFISRRAFWEGYGKALLKMKFKSAGKKSGVLTTEYSLLRKIISYRLPRSLGLLFRKPRNAFRQLGLIITVLSCVAAGYLRFNIDSFFGRKRI